MFGIYRKHFVAACLIGSLAIHLIAGFLTVGFHHYDEHYQILEPLYYKLHNGEPSDLPWEFRSQIRPWFQPAILTAITKFWEILGVQNPFFLATTFRILSALLGWSVIVGFVLCSLRWFRSESLQRHHIFWTCFLWCLPYLHARPSSESWSGSLFFLGFLPLIYSVQQKRSPSPILGIVCGLLMGAAFECRYQVGIMVLCAFIWCVVFSSFTKKALFAVVIGIMSSIVIGAICDRWGYGKWTLTPYNYFMTNIIGQKSSEWGVSPWWYYFPKVLSSAFPPLSIFLVVGSVAAWFLKPRLSLTWITAPFFLVHMLIPHKELRFLFPIVVATPTLVFFSIAQLGYQGALKRLLYPLSVFLIFLNTIGLIGLSCLPARTEIGVYKYLYDHSVSTLWTNDINPFDIVGPKNHFYRPTGFSIRRYSSFDEILQNLKSSNEPIWVFHTGFDIPHNYVHNQCHIAYQTIPSWAQKPPYLAFLRRANAINWSLYRCQK